MDPVLPTPNRYVLITGASGHLGTALIPVLRQKGYGICASSVYSPLPDPLFSLVDHFQQVDLAHEQAVADYIDHLVSIYPTLNAAVLLVGGYAGGTIRKTDAALLDRMIELNFKTAYHVVRPLMNHFEHTGGGQFVLISARPAVDMAAGKNMVAYALSKNLLVQLSTLINREGSTKKVHSTVVVPSTIDTSENRISMPEADFSTWVRREDLAETIAFVLSEPGNNLRDSVLKVYHDA